MLTRILKNRRTTFLQFRKQAFGYGMHRDFDPGVDYYKVLGVNKSQGESEMKKAYYKLAQ
jgi:hypothetical protein